VEDFPCEGFGFGEVTGQKAESRKQVQVPHPPGKAAGFGMTIQGFVPEMIAEMSGEKPTWLARSIEEGFLDCASRQPRRSEVEEEASARSARNDRSGRLVQIVAKIN
jgi:hypothetical protein